MGYSIHQISSTFVIPYDKTKAALQALKQLHGRETCGKPGGMHFMWINNSSEFLEATSLAQALRTWRWQATLDEDGGIAELDFVGENNGNEDLLFQALSPFVRDDSVIVVVGEDAQIWRWRFSDGKVYRENGRLAFDGDDPSGA